MRNRVAAIAAVMLLAGMAPVMAAPTEDVIPKDRAPKPHDTAPLPSAWVLRGDNADEYAVGVDKLVTYAGTPSGFIRSIGFNMDGFGTLASHRPAAAFRGRTVSLSAMVKTDQIRRWAYLWVGYDIPGRSFMPAGAKTPDLTMSRFSDTLLGSLDWRRVTLELPVPANATDVYLGLVMSGQGTAYVTQVSLDVVAPKTPVAPNLDFAPTR